jgi:hypothetical protein
METTVYELEKQLKIKKEQQKEESLQKELDGLIHLKGKCFATHTLGRKTYPQKEVIFRKVHDVYIKETSVVYDIETVSYTRYSDSAVNFQVSKHLQAHHWQSYEKFKYEITEQQWQSVLRSSIAVVDVLGNTIREGLQEPKEIISQGDYTKETNEVKLLLGSGIAVIDLQEYKDKGDSNLTIAEYLSWHHHPLVIAGRYLVNNQYSKQMVVTMANTMEQEALSWGSSIWTRDKPRIEMVRKFVKSVKWEE